MNELRFRREVGPELRRGRLWYERQREGLGAEFMTSVDALLQRIARAPQEFPVVHRRIRRALLRPFPYAVFFMDKDDHLLVLGVMHQAVDPARWQSRG